MDNHKEIKGVQGVFIYGNEIVITGCPAEEDENHNCDEMCCGSLEHVIFRGLLCLMKKGYSEETQEVALGGGGDG